MRLNVCGTVALFLALAVSSPSAKGIPSRITIEGGNLNAPIQIDDPNVVASFNVWAGRGTRSGGIEGSEGFIIDWSSGAVAAPDPELHRFVVSFFVKDPNRKSERLVYVVSYVYDRSNRQGYVYLPGHGDKEYGLNAATIHRKREGNWFRAAPSWQRAVTPLIARDLVREELFPEDLDPWAGEAYGPKP